MTIDKPQIVVDGERGVCSGAAGIAYSSQADYTNCHVKGGSISFTYKDTDDNASVISVAGLSVGGRTFTNCSNSAEIKVVTTNTTGTTVCGIATRAIKVNKCKNEGTISVNSIQADMIAGVAGFADKMIDCSNSGTINAISRQVDIVSGVAGETARITRCNNFGKIKVSGGCASIGGVVATAYNQIIFCKNTGNISGKIYKGIFGYETSIGGVASGYGKAVKCVNSGKIKLTIREIPKVTVGGVCGAVGSSFFCKNLSSIKINYSSKNSSNADSYIGGVFGEQNGKAQYCYNKGNIILKGISGQVGGVVGHAWLIRECCNTGDIKCTGGRNGGCFGGLVGYLGSNEKTFIGNYAAGKIKTSSNKHKTGALVGFGYNNYIKYVKICKGNCYSYGKQAFGRPKKYKNVKTKAKKITVSEMRILCEKRFKKIDKRIKKK